MYQIMQNSNAYSDLNSRELPYAPSMERRDFFSAYSKGQIPNNNNPNSESETSISQKEVRQAGIDLNRQEMGGANSRWAQPNYVQLGQNRNPEGLSTAPESLKSLERIEPRNGSSLPAKAEGALKHTKDILGSLESMENERREFRRIIEEKDLKIQELVNKLLDESKASLHE